MGTGLAAMLAVPPAAWSLQEMLGWYIGSHACVTMSLGMSRVLVAIMSMALFAVAVAAGAVAARTRTAAPAPHSEFAGIAIAFITGAFAIGIIWAGFGGALIMRCGVTR